MTERGQLWGIQLGEDWLFKMVPWAFGIFEFQLPHLDREMSEMWEEYHPAFGQEFFSKTPQMMQTLPIEEEIHSEQEALTYERVSSLIAPPSASWSASFWPLSSSPPPFSSPLPFS